MLMIIQHHFNMPNLPIAKKKPWHEERVVQGRRLHDNSKFYNARKWRKVSKAYKASNPLCECLDCNKKVFSEKCSCGGDTKSTVVNHN